MNKYKVGDYNGSHTHPWSMYSGVIFLTGDADNMVFIKQNTYNEEVIRVTSVHDVYKYPATNGKMVVFPSNLHHYVIENKNDIEFSSVMNQPFKNPGSNAVSNRLIANALNIVSA